MTASGMPLSPVSVECGNATPTVAGVEVALPAVPVALAVAVVVAVPFGALPLPNPPPPPIPPDPPEPPVPLPELIPLGIGGRLNEKSMSAVS